MMLSVVKKPIYNCDNDHTMSGKQPRRYVLSTPDGTLVSTKNIIPTRGKLQQVGLKKNNVPTQRGALMYCTFQANE